MGQRLQYNRPGLNKNEVDVKSLQNHFRARDCQAICMMILLILNKGLCKGAVPKQGFYVFIGSHAFTPRPKSVC